MNNFLALDHNWTDIEQIKQLLYNGHSVTVTEQALSNINRCRDFLDTITQDENNVFYGINTGFGYLQNVKINANELEELQYNLLKSHACGLGDEVPLEIVKLMMVLKIKSLSYGYSGVQAQTVQRLAAMYNEGVYPVVYTQGSLGASGDLAPLSHLCLPIIGLGEVWYKGQKMPAAQALAQLGWEPVHLKSKEGLALINGTQFMSAYGIYALIKASQLLHMADLIAAISFDAFDCVADCLHESIHKIRPHKGQVATAARLRKYLEGSSIVSRKKQQVQDPYSFRCIPQVHGASKDVFETVLNVFLTEINAVTDNPNVFPDESLILSGGNFHGQTLSLHLDFLSIAMSEIGNISERRTYQLIGGQRELPLFLVKNPGLHSGFMIPQYTAAGIASENKQLCTPASVDSIPSSNNQEDHVSMGANAATKCLRVLNNVERILAIELFTATQALEFRRPLQSSTIVESVFEAFRKQVSFNDADRILHDDMLQAVQFVKNYPVEKIS